MHSTRFLRAASTADALGIARDPLLRWMLLVPLIAAAAFRWLLPGPVQTVGARIGVDLFQYYPQLAGYILLTLPPTICGTLVGFLLLDQRDEQTLRALRVTPLPLGLYLAYRLAAPMLLGMLLSMVALWVLGSAQLSPGELLASTLAAAPLAPLTALFLGALAANKVQGFALQKLIGVPLILPALALFLPAPWGSVAAIVPTSWPAQLFWQLLQGRGIDWGTLLVGLVYQGLLIALLLRRLARQAS
jgi:fluoroquinolone transport system permease protein